MTTYVPVNFTIDEIIKYADLPDQLKCTLIEELEGKLEDFEQVQTEVTKLEKRIELLEEVQHNASNLVRDIKYAIKARSFRYNETKDFVKVILNFIDNWNIED